MSLTLLYLPFRGRGEQIRLLLHLLDVPFEDRHLSRPDFGALKQQGAPATYFGSLPAIVDGDFHLSQGPAIMTYLARKYGIAPTEPQAAARAEAITLGAEDLRNRYFRIAGKDKDEERARFLSGDWTKRWLPSLEGLLAHNGRGDVFVGDAITQADIAVWDVLNAMLTYVPEATLQGHARVEAFYAKIESQPSLARYLSQRPD